MTAISVEPGGAPTPGQVSDDALTVLAPLPPTGRSVSVSEIIRMAVDSLVANKVRSLLTMLGVIIGVAAVVALLSLGSGASALITGQIESIGTNVLTVMAGQQQGPPGERVEAQTPTYADAQAIAALNLPVVGPAPQYGSSASIVAPAADTRANVTGVTPAYQMVNTLTLRAGSFIGEGQVQGASQVIVLGANYLVSSISLSVIDSDDIDYVQARIERLLRERHRLVADGSEDDFSVLNQASFLSTLTTITSVFTYFLGTVAGISLLVGGIGIMNIMLVSVTERTREIGLRKAVGARGRDILLQFVVEALVLSVTGGLIGLLLGAVIPVTVTLLGLLEAPVTVSAALIAVGFSLAVGLFFGIYPARRAARLDPIEALRYE